MFARHNSKSTSLLEKKFRWPSHWNEPIGKTKNRLSEKCCEYVQEIGVIEGWTSYPLQGSLVSSKPQNLNAFYPKDTSKQKNITTTTDIRWLSAHHKKYKNA